MTNSAIQSVNNIERFLQEVAATEKKAAEAHTEPGSIGGPTEHPVKDVDDFTENASEGFRSTENEEDVKEDQGPASVENTPDNVAAKKAMDGKSEDGSINPPGTASSDQCQIGTKKEPTGQDPSVETASVKAEKEDPASAPDGSVGHSASPARTNNSELDGYKYASMSIEQLQQVVANQGNDLLAKVASYTKAADCSCDKSDCDDCNPEKSAKLKGNQHKLDANGNGKLEGSDFAALRNGADAKDDKSKPEIKEASNVAGQAGWELAGLLNGQFDKQAARAAVTAKLEHIIQDGSSDAVKVAEFLTVYSGELQKQAMGEMPQGVDPAALMGEEPGGMPGEADEAAMIDAMAGGEADEMAGGGDDVAQLAAVLDSLGISPEELDAAMAAEGGGEMPPEEPMMDEAATAGEAPGMEVEASDKRAAAKKGAADKSMRDYIQEVLDRSRR